MRAAVVLVFAALGACAHTQSVPDNARAPGIDNGLYAVVGTGATPEEAAALGPHRAVLAYDGRYTESPEDMPEYVAIEEGPFVPLILEGEPESHTDERGHATLGVTLQKDQAAALEEFTRAHLGGRVAIVLGGEIVTKHKVREVVTGGRLQITRCTDNACTVLRSKLVD